MRYKRQYTLYPVKRKTGKPIWYFRVYLPSGKRRAKSTGFTSKEKAVMYVEKILKNESLLRYVFETDINCFSKTNNSLSPLSSLKPIPIITFGDYAKNW